MSEVVEKTYGFKVELPLELDLFVVRFKREHGLKTKSAAISKIVALFMVAQELERKQGLVV